MSDVLIQPEGPRSERIAALDGYRGVAVLTIVCFHSFILHVQLRPGSLLAYVQKYCLSFWIGVDAFFVLSGFLIGGILLERRAAPNLFRVFYLRRTLRIFPPYFLLLGGWVVALQFGDAPGMNWLLEPAFPIWPYFGYLQNFWIAMRGSLGPGFVMATWSLAIEEQFYLLFPVLLRMTPVRGVPMAIGLGILVPPLLRYSLALRGAEWKQAIAVLLPLRWDSLLVGVLVAWVVRERRALIWLGIHRRVTTGVFVMLSIWMAILPLVLNVPEWSLSPWRSLVVRTGIALFFGAMILLLQIGSLGGLSAILSSRVLRYFGKVSYFLYLFHCPFLGLTFVVMLGKAPALANVIDWAVMALALLLCLVAANLSWRWLEEPLVTFGRRFAYDKPTPGSTVTSA